MLMLQYSQSELNELLNSDRHVDHDRHLQSQPTSEGAYTMLSLKIPQILVDRDRHLHSPAIVRGRLHEGTLGTIHLKKAWICGCSQAIVVEWSFCLLAVQGFTLRPFYSKK